MITVAGKYNTADCYCSSLESKARSQIQNVCDRREFAGCKIRIMPDVHAGMGCTIGTTMTVSDKVVPAMVGVDIGCGMETVRIKERRIDFNMLDKLIRREIPGGRHIRRTPHSFAPGIDFTKLFCADHVDLERASLSIGTLGGGNHFIEVDVAGDGTLYIIVHSGSRHLGNQAALYYQNAGYEKLCEASASCGSEDQIPKDLAYVEGKMFDEYINDMAFIQNYALMNRKAMIDIIISGMGLTALESFSTIHNYIDINTMILRKGAVSALKGQKLLIPVNMRDGSLICMGKGNPDWNYSAPHGAGRLMNRRAAFEQLSMAEYTFSMKDVFSTCISRNTLDEAPMAYKSIDEIIEFIGPTAEITERIKPVFNFKAP